MVITGIIYKIDCEISGKSYIGKTIQPLAKRISQHKLPNKNKCRAISQSIQEHGWENFKVSIIWEGNADILGEMENKLIREHKTLEPNGYNIREGGGRSERVSKTSKQLMIEKQREISKRRNGLLGRIVSNGYEKITSWSVLVPRNGIKHTLGSFKTKQEALEAQQRFTDNPDSYKIPNSKRVGNGKGKSYYYERDRGKWKVMPYINGKNVYLGRYDTEQEARDVIEKYKTLDN